MHRPPARLLLSAVVFCACASDPEGMVDSGTSPSDGGTPGSDSGSAPNTDAGMPGSACGSDSNLSRIDFTHDGNARGAQVHLPSDYDGTPRALVLNFHGRDSTVAQQRTISLMDSTADAQGFIVAYPEGIANTFNAGFCCGEAQSQNIDDVGFSLALLDQLESKLCIDSSRIYATGLSNGGYMTQRLACEAPERFAGFSSVAGLLATVSCTPSVKKPIVHFHGTADSIVSYDSNGFLSGAEDTMDAWATRNGCDQTSTTVYNQGDASCVRYDGCPAGKDVELCTIAEGGHTWPGGTPVPFLGNTSTDISANDYMWSFWNP